MDKEEEIKYQWIRGDDIGDVETVDNTKEDENFIYFISGKRVFKKSINEFMKKVNNNNYYFTEEDLAQMRGETLQQNTKKPIQKNNKPTKTINNNKQESSNVNSIVNLLKNGGDKNDHPMSIELLLPFLPKKEVFDVLFSIYTEEEIEEGLTDFVKNNADLLIKQIIKSIK